MSQSPKKKLLEENIEEQSDAEIAEKTVWQGRQRGT